jgi:hypothetical protein
MLQTIDPFSGLVGGELYIPACTLMLQLKYTQGVEKIKTWFKESASTVSKLTDRVNIFIAALFTQLTSQQTQVSKAYLKQLIAFFQEQITASNPEAFDYQLHLDAISHFWNATGVKTSVNATIQSNLKLHILLLALSPTCGWLRTLLQNPKEFVKGYMPSMIDDEFAIFTAVTDSSGNLVPEVGWYECRNGHKYSVGNCTRPMQVANCPSCGVKIGGTNHQSEVGVRELGTTPSFGKSLAGYAMDSTGNPRGYEIGRLGKLTTVILRYIIHTVMLISSEMYPTIDGKKGEAGNGVQSTVAELMFPTDPAGTISVDRVQNELNARLTADWKEIETLMEMEEEDLAMGLHMIIKAMMGRPVSYTDDGSSFGMTPSDYEYAMNIDRQQRGLPAAPQSSTKKFNMPPANMSPKLR